MTRPRIEIVYGTRPEAVKCAPLVAELIAREGVDTIVTVTGQHRAMTDEVNDYFAIRPDADLDVFRADSTLAQTAPRIFAALSERWSRDAPDAVVVQGDTASAALAAVAAHYAKALVIHLEAGLRSGDLFSPFPEEGNRRLITSLASLHLAPTDLAAGNLLAEGVPAENVVVTGNTGIDALYRQRAHPQPFDDPAIELALEHYPRLVLVTMHRRESWGGGLAEVTRGVADTIASRTDTVAVIPLHPNPLVRGEVGAAVAGAPRVVLCDALPYAQFGRLLARAHCVVTDSGGVQEEAPALGVPVLVARDRTERGEGLAAGAARLVGTDRANVSAALASVLDDDAVHASMSRAVELYGDGRAAVRAADAIETLLGVTQRRPAAA
ncbi:non-hydrolyzing UDP-N-acetylglucosamine 2-epimerase [Microbacterium sp. SORGH_AS_0888]|uniref:non-hydrolyzing UDP-N-acetylglucosamine 2-epimerase n=1 Tax=Microbacterium sp. SORGH_AS_0888 TaxID=3041791 RepID=UPI002787FB91|nr:UDP-N-acetylglucosamine 2-epimerase (non-hydrolyzing) [Microbacterium sp. SORGH_AS_0888]MDQ1131380.1 UDP-N-acetylglucosamine 2-epimerase (non-hydrolyzing) [Microbacterium sp. SORGH_AS_0888]